MKKNKLTKTNGFAAPEILMLVCCLIVVGLAGYFVFKSKPAPKATASQNVKLSSNPSVSQSSNPYAVLAPATVPPKVAECSTQVSYGAHGNPMPLQCSNGELNVAAWSALSALEPTVMSLGYSATEQQVQSSICTDANAADADSSASSSNAIETSVYQLSKVYYGWNFSSDPTAVLSNGTC